MNNYFCTYYPSPVGRLTLASDGTSLCGLWIENQRFYANNCLLTEKGDLPIFKSVSSWLNRYFGAERVIPTELPLNPLGTAFQKTVWENLCKIPYGTTITYGELSRKVASTMGVSSMSAQAVGGAVGKNPISIIIPCHRVVGSDGSLVGYAGGLDAKRSLLNLEQNLLF